MDEYKYVQSQELKDLIKERGKMLAVDIEWEMDKVYKKIFQTFNTDTEYTKKAIEYILPIIEGLDVENVSDIQINNAVKEIYKFMAGLCNELLEEINKETELLIVQMSPVNMDLIGTLKGYNHESILLHFTCTD